MDGKVILKWIIGRIGWDVADWIHLAQDRVHWRTLVNKVMKLRVP
jgi:hypothetical protein